MAAAGFIVALWAVVAGVVKGGSHPGALSLYPPKKISVRAFVDNFDPSNNGMFNQRAFFYDKWWHSGGPVLLYLGNEGPLEAFYNYTGAMFEHAAALGALVAFVEHRGYGESMPLPTGRSSPEQLRFLTVEQAMADYAWFLQGLRRNFSCGAADCPTVVLGGSYGGMLVAWFRQKYPSLTVGGLAASAPVDFYPGDGRQVAFWNATLHTFETFGLPGCAGLLTNAVAALHTAAATTHGRTDIAHLLGSCDPLENETTAGEKVASFLQGVAASLAMLDYPEASSFVVPLPANPVAAACKAVRNAQQPLIALRAIADLYLNGTGSFDCYDYLAEMVGRPTLGELKGPRVPPDMGPWQYQACNELILETLSSDGFAFYPPADDQLDAVAAACQLRFGVTPRPGWLPLSLAGSDLRIGNLLFTDGEKDPWRTGAPKMSKVRPGLDITHHVISGAAHHEDLRFDGEPPRPQVQAAKQLGRESMRRWMRQHSSILAV